MPLDDRRYVMRPVQSSDVAHIYDLALSAKPGMTTLPKNKAFLEASIQQAVQSFSSPSVDKQNFFMFVCEDLERGRVIGTSGIRTQKGSLHPDISFHRKEKMLMSESLKVQKHIHYLTLRTNRDHPSEIGTLYLSPEYRGTGIGRLLSFSRFLFMAMFPDVVDSKVIAEFRGYSDDAGVSPFWEAVGRKFIDIDYDGAVLISASNKEFMKELLPIKHLYLELIPPEAAQVVGTVHPNTEPAFKLLQDQGFKRIKQVDIFDAGPRVAALRSRIKLVKNAASYESVIAMTGGGKLQWLFGSGDSVATFKASWGYADQTKGQLKVSSHTADVLGISTGNTLWATPL